jgi:FtsP/CotA-like multicopper oxidase with cupredoxin domain
MTMATTTTTTRRIRYFILGIFMYQIGIEYSSAERIFEEVHFTPEACTQLGYANEFEACAEIEFCTSSDRNRHLDVSSDFKNNIDDLEQSFVEEVHQAEHKESKSKTGDFTNQHMNPIPNHAKYGWKLSGSQTCSWPGPIIRLKRGIHHGLFVRGSAYAATNIHFHGLHIPGYGNGDSMYRSIQGQENIMIYGLRLPEDQHLGGTHWYHSHLKGQSWDQVMGGAFGMIVIDDNGHDVGTDDENVLRFLQNEKILILDNADGTWRANGVYLEKFQFVKDEWYRLRILAVNLNSHSDQEIVSFSDGCLVHALAHDGIFNFQVPSRAIMKTAILTSSSRLDVAIKCSTDSTISLDNYYTLVNIHVDDSIPPTAASPWEEEGSSWNSTRLSYVDDLRQIEPSHYWRVEIDETNINQIGESHHMPLCDDNGNDFEYGTVVEVQLVGAETHPFHMHVYPLQVISNGCGSGHSVGEFYDTIVTADRGNGIPCILRFHLVDIMGPTLVHCHIFEHAEHGAIGWFNVVGGGPPMLEAQPTCQKGSTCTDFDKDTLPMCSDRQN